jgi:FMN phosphatase YigB (HAD superfamily)
MSTPHAITFDYWNTLMVEQPAVSRSRRVGAWHHILCSVAPGLDLAAVGDALDAGFVAHEQAWIAGEAFGPTGSTDHALTHLGLDPDVQTRTALVDALILGAVGVLEMAPNAPETLRALHTAGIRLGIICDVGWTSSVLLRGELERHGVLDLFSHWTFSDEVGCYKPDSASFAHALAGLGVDDPSDAAHVGDLRRTDVAGAHAHGMIAVRYAGVFDDRRQDLPDAAHVIRDHAELLSLFVPAAAAR